MRSYFSYGAMLRQVKRMYMICWIYQDFAFIVKNETWWRHQKETFSALLALCAENSPVTDEFPAQRPATRCFDAFFDLHWINNWVNNRAAGDLRRHRAHYDVTVMVKNENRTWKRRRWSETFDSRGFTGHFQWYPSVANDQLNITISWEMLNIQLFGQQFTIRWLMGDWADI